MNLYRTEMLNKNLVKLFKRIERLSQIQTGPRRNISSNLGLKKDNSIMGQSESSKNFWTQECWVTKISRSIRRLWMISIKYSRTSIIKTASNTLKMSVSSIEDTKVHTANQPKRELALPPASCAFKPLAVVHSDQEPTTQGYQTISTPKWLNLQILSTETIQPWKIPFRSSLRSTGKKWKKNIFKMATPKICFSWISGWICQHKVGMEEESMAKDQCKLIHMASMIAQEILDIMLIRGKSWFLILRIWKKMSHVSSRLGKKDTLHQISTKKRDNTQGIQTPKVVTSQLTSEMLPLQSTIQLVPYPKSKISPQILTAWRKFPTAFRESNKIGRASCRERV